MTWPDAVALLTVFSVVCWILIASLFIGFDPQGDMLANDKEIRDLIDFATAAGSEEADAAPTLPEGSSAGTSPGGVKKD